MEPSDHRAPLLEVRGLSKDFGGLHALQAIDLDVHDGEIVGIIGPNGSGKTTFFNVLSRYLSGDLRQIRFAEHADITRLPAASCHPQRHRQDISEPAAVQPDDRAGERARRHGVAHQGGSAVDHAGAARRARGEGGCRTARDRTARSVRHRGSRRAAIARPIRCPMPIAGAWRSPAHWPPSRACCCSTNRPPA